MRKDKTVDILFQRNASWDVGPVRVQLLRVLAHGRCWGYEVKAELIDHKGCGRRRVLRQSFRSNERGAAVELYRVRWLSYERRPAKGAVFYA